MRSYLDDPEHEWEIDPGSKEHSLWGAIDQLDNEGTDESIEIVLLGYEGLRQRHPEATVQECFITSMIWLFG